MKDLPSTAFKALDGYFEDPRFDWLRTRSTRRLIAIAYIANLAAFALVTWFVDNYWLGIPFILFYMLSTLALAGSTRGIADRPGALLDEQQDKTRNAGYRNAYWAGVMLAFLGGIFIADNSSRDTAFEMGLFIAVWGMLSALPTLVLAWTMPPEVHDEEE